MTLATFAAGVWCIAAATAASADDHASVHRFAVSSASAPRAVTGPSRFVLSSGTTTVPVAAVRGGSGRARDLGGTADAAVRGTHAAARDTNTVVRDTVVRDTNTVVRDTVVRDTNTVVRDTVVRDTHAVVQELLANVAAPAGALLSDVTGLAPRYADPLVRALVPRADRAAAPRVGPRVPRTRPEGSTVDAPTAPDTVAPATRPRTVAAARSTDVPLRVPVDATCAADRSDAERRAAGRLGSTGGGMPVWTDPTSASDAGASTGLCAVPGAGPPPLPRFGTVPPTPASASAAGVAAAEPPVYPD